MEDTDVTEPEGSEASGPGVGGADSSDDEAEDGMESEDESDDDDTTMRIEACGDAPEAPLGYKYADEPPPLATETEQRALKGKKIFTARVDKEAQGWFIGTVKYFGVSNKDKETTPTATHVVEYKMAETKTKALVGNVAYELSASNYGRKEWWVLLEKV